jgi:aconitate hydratase
MINGLGVVGWGVGGIEAEAGMLGQPVYFLTPEVVGVHMSGTVARRVTATDLVLHITQLLRAQKVVGKFVEFYGEGAASLPVPDEHRSATCRRSTVRQWAFFPVDQESVNYLRATGRTEEQCLAFENYFRAQNMFGMPRKGEIDYSVDIDLDLADVQPSVADRRGLRTGLICQSSGESFANSLKNRCTTAATERNRSIFAKSMLVELNGSAPRNGAMFSTDTKEDQGISAGEALNKLEMVQTDQPPIRAKKSKPESSKCSYMGVLTLATAAS